MEKNTIVLDELGTEIGRTYPKRARGLVKNGRAEYVDDCTIRLINAHVPTMIDDSVMEENEMSKDICFNARDLIRPVRETMLVRECLLQICREKVLRFMKSVMADH